MLILPPWMIERLERARREREAPERPALWRELPERPDLPPDREPSPRPAPTAAVIDLG